MLGVAPAHFISSSSAATMPDMPPVGELQPVVLLERDGLRKVDGDLVAMYQPDHPAADTPLVMGKHGNVPHVSGVARGDMSDDTKHFTIREKPCSARLPNLQVAL